MAGMHRDKCGAAAVAGFFQVNDAPTLYQNNKCLGSFLLQVHTSGL